MYSSSVLIQSHHEWQITLSDKLKFTGPLKLCLSDGGWAQEHDQRSPHVQVGNMTCYYYEHQNGKHWMLGGQQPLEWFT
ncbi:hypothetical protein BDR05DRAFT_969650 [Suillus weaverae]|nr:hypothetical protein BDR05DRAFT_969650 [Suillus weaverae]